LSSSALVKLAAARRSTSAAPRWVAACSPKAAFALLQQVGGRGLHPMHDRTVAGHGALDLSAGRLGGRNLLGRLRHATSATARSTAGVIWIRSFISCSF